MSFLSRPDTVSGMEILNVEPKKTTMSSAKNPLAKGPDGQKIEAITTCVGFSDILAHTLPMNKNHFDRILVLTAPEDRDTQLVCDYWGVTYHPTDLFETRWNNFKKGAAINRGLKELDKDAWIVHIDSDIALQPNFRQVIKTADLDTSMIYGIDRVDVPSWADWQKFIGKPEPHTQGMGFIVHIEHTGFKFGARVAFPHQGGYIPIGYFQMWHADSGIMKYPEGHTDAGREDSHFATLWPRKKRALIPEMIAYHLESEHAPMAENWKGRKTKPFSIDSL